MAAFHKLNVSRCTSQINSKRALITGTTAQYGTAYVSAMPTNLYGPGDNFDLETSHVLPALIRKFHLGACLDRRDWDAVRRDLDRRPVAGVDGPASQEAILEVLARHGVEMAATPAEGRCRITLWGTGTPRREFLHVEDMAEACVRIGLETDETGLLNIGCGEDLSIRDLADMTARVVGYGGDIRFDASKPDGTPRKLLDVSRITTLGWHPRLSLEEGIRKTYEWYGNDLRDRACHAG